MEINPTRGVALVLGATVYDWVPLPAPGPVPMVIHEVVVETVQPHGVLTLTLNVPPAAGTDWLIGEIE